MKDKINLTQGKISLSLVKLAFPIIATNFIQISYSLVDMVWIGRLGSNALAAVGTAGFFIHAAFAISSLVLTGAGIKTAQSVGAKQEKEAKNIIVNSFLLTAALGIFYSALVILFNQRIIGFLNLGDNLIEEMASVYLIVSAFGIIFMYFNLLFASIYNSYGNSKLPFRINSAGFILNIILDPILIFGFWKIGGLGILGAGIASLISRILVFGLFMVQAKNHFKILRSKINFNYQKSLAILKLGAPLALQRSLFVLIAIIMARIIADWGAIAIAVQRIGLTIESLSFMVIGGLYVAMNSFVGQNYGAKKYARIKQGYKIGLFMSFAYGLIITFSFVIFSKEIFSLFLQDPKGIVLGIDYLKVIGYSQVFMCVEIITMASFNALGKTYIPALVSIGLTSLRIPLAIFLSSAALLGLEGVWWTISLSSVLKGVVLVSWFLIFINFKLTQPIQAQK